MFNFDKKRVNKNQNETNIIKDKSFSFALCIMRFLINRASFIRNDKVYRNSYNLGNRVST